MHIVFGSIVLALMADMTNCYYAKGGGSRPKRDLESLQRISSTERRCIPEKELQEKENERYALFGRNELDMERAQNCMGLPEEAVLMFCWATNCGFEIRKWEAVGDNMLARCRAGLVGGPFPIMRADQNRFYDKSSGIFIRCTANGALVAQQSCETKFLIRELDERKLEEWYEIGSVFDCGNGKRGPFGGDLV